MSRNQKLLLWLTFVLAVVARIYTACATLNILHPDEHFQTLEPALHVATQNLAEPLGWLSWEWNVMLRSWLIPWLYSLPIRAVNTFSPGDGLLAILWCRSLTAILSSVMLWQLWRWSRKLGFSAFAQWTLLFFTGLSPIWVQIAPATLSDIWAMDAIWIFMPMTHTLWEKNRRFVAATLLFLPLLFRIQTLAFSISAAAVLFVMANSRDEAKARLRSLIGGLSIALTIQGVIDWVSWGSFLKSTIVNFQKNFLENVASFYGVDPWWHYLANFGAWYGWELIAALIAAALFCAPARARNALPPMVMAAGAGSFCLALAHFFIPHKEARFIYPALPGLWFAALMLLRPQLDILADKLRETLGAQTFLWGLTLFCGVSVTLGASHYDNYPQSNMSTLPIAIQQDGGFKKSSERCLLLVGQYWIWTHGELLQWSRLTYKEIPIEKVTDSDILACPFTIVLPQNEDKLKALANGRLELMERDPRGYALYRRR